MKIRKPVEYEVTCKGCGSLLRVGFEELKFKGIMDQRMTCPACGGNVLVVLGGMIAPDVTPKIYSKSWEDER